MNLPVAWPNEIQDKIKGWGLSPGDILGLIQTVEGRLQNCGEQIGALPLELSLPSGDYYMGDDIRMRTG